MHFDAPTKRIAIVVIVFAASAFAFYAFRHEQMVTIGWDRNPAATSYNCYLDDARFATHVSPDVLRCSALVSAGMHTVGVTSVGVGPCPSTDGTVNERQCEAESAPASITFVKPPFLKPIHVRVR
jgi:hypothetical protein